RRRLPRTSLARRPPGRPAPAYDRGMTALPDAPADLGLVRDEPMSRHTYMRLGGPAAYFGTPETLEDLDRMVDWAHGVGLPVRVAGGGSNVLVADAGVEALVISLRRCARAVLF